MINKLETKVLQSLT